MRGIVILEVLRQVQVELGYRIRFQDFFDLIVGTRSVDSLWQFPKMPLWYEAC